MLKKTINFSIMEDIISSYLYWGLRFSLSDGFIRNKYFFPISIGKVTNIFTDNEEFLKLVERLNSFFVFFPYIFNSIFTHANINRYIYKIIYKGAQRNILQISNAERH